MTTTKRYIQLTSSDGSLAKRFKVVFAEDGYRPLTLRRRTVRETASGKLDIQHGAHYRAWQYLLSVHAEESDSTFGTIWDLEAFLDYRRPPDDILLLQNHLGDLFSVTIDCDFEPANQTPMLDGSNAWYMVPVLLREVDAKAPFYYQAYSGLTVLLQASKDVLGSAGQEAEDGEAVSGWGGQLGTESATQGTVGFRPTWDAQGPNYRPSILFDAGDDYLILPGTLDDYISNSAFTMLAVVELGTATGQILADSGSKLLLYRPATATLRLRHNDGSDDDAEATVADGDICLIEAYHSGGSLSLRINGESPDTVASGNTASLAGSMALGTALGGGLAELGIYDTFIGDVALKNWREYAATKYGVEL